MGTPRLGAIAALLLAALAAAVSCSSEAPEDRRRAVLDRAADRVHAIVADAVRRAHEAVDGVDAALSAAGTDRAARFAALEALRVRTRVDGLAWDHPGGSGVWAGEPTEPRPLPAPPPWEASFRTGDTTYHAGPFVRALVVSKDGAAGGVAEASIYLRAPGEAPTQIPAETRWAAELRVQAVRLLPGDAPPPAGDVVRRPVIDPHPPAATIAIVEVESPGDEALAEMAREDRERGAGFLWLGALAAAVLVSGAALARLPARARALGVAVAAVLARFALRALDLPDRFAVLEPAFQAADFGVPGYLGWLSSPGDLFLTALATLAAAIGVARAVRDVAPRAPLPRAAAFAAGVLGSVGVSLAWLLLVKVAALHTQLDYFRPGRLLPSLARGLVLSGLVAATAAAYVLSSAALRAASAALGGRPGLAAVVVAALAGVLSVLAAPAEFPAWAALLLPVAGGVVPLLSPHGVRPGPASRVLLTSVLATAILFPALWVRLAMASRDGLPSDVSTLVGREEVVASDLRVDLQSLAGDAHLRDALERAAAGDPPPDGLALYAWHRLSLGARPEGGAVFVLDDRGRTIDRFWLDTPPASRLPGPATAPEDWTGDVAASAGVEHPEKVRSTVAAVRVRGSDARERGRVVVVVPDRLTTELEGLHPRSPSPGEEDEGVHDDAALALTLVREGRVVATNEPALPRAAFPPLPEASSAGEARWVRDADGGDERWALPLEGGRGVLLARRARGGEHTVLALARAAIVGVGLGAVGALGVLVLSRGRRRRAGLAQRILLSYFAISVVPLVLLAAATIRSAAVRHEGVFRERHATLVRTARDDLAALGASLFDEAQGRRLETYAGQRGIDVSVYRDGGIAGSSLWPQVEADLFPARLPAEAYRATQIEGRDTLGREERFAGRPVRVAYAPIRDERGTPVGTVAVPLLHDTDQADREAAQTASVLLATYLLTLVLVVVVGIYLAREIARPIDLLAEGTARVAAGEEEVVLPEAGGAEMASLVAAFNRMTRDLKAVRDRAAAAERDAAWKGMARQVAHEIKNPLTPMQLLLQHLVAVSKEDPAAGREALEPTAKVVLEQIDALRRIAGDFATFAGGPRRVVEDLDVNVLLASLGTLYAGGAPPYVRVETALAASLPPIRADADELRRAFVNILGNAMEAVDAAVAADPGSAADPGKRMRVVLRSERARAPDGREGVRVAIEDTGIGIPAASLPRLFEPSFSTKSSGTGLGLPIVRRIVTDFGGSIRVDSEPGKGTTVSVWLPASRP
jgi:signal transduction histidine kinase